MQSLQALYFCLHVILHHVMHVRLCIQEPKCLATRHARSVRQFGSDRLDASTKRLGHSPGLSLHLLNFSTPHLCVEGAGAGDDLGCSNFKEVRLGNPVDSDQNRQTSAINMTKVVTEFPPTSLLMISAQQHWQARERRQLKYIYSQSRN